MKKEITALAKSLKISEIGFCGADFYLKKAKNEKKTAAFASSDSKEAVLFGAKTVIVCAFAYYAGDAAGNISLYARGRDYHKVVAEKLGKICDFLGEKGYSAKAYADTGALSERLLAKLSGLAFIGKNQMAINKRLGSYFFIGYVVTDCDIEPDGENTKTCIGCGKCVAACPGGALLDGGFCEEKCLSYITQKKGELTKAEKDAMIREGTIWGCDRCQRVCPHNEDVQLCEIEEFREDLICNLDMNEDISGRQFSKKYEDRAFSWRGKGVLKRNYDTISCVKKSRNTHI